LIFHSFPYTTLFRSRHLNDRKYWLLPLTFGLNAGWLFIATVVNIAAYLVQIEWDGFGIAEDTWALIIMIEAQVSSAIPKPSHSIDRNSTRLNSSHVS